MDERGEALSSILEGCRLAKKLELNLPSLENHQSSLFSSCEAISRTFTTAMNQLNCHHQSSYTHMNFGRSSESSSKGHDVDRSCYKPEMDLLYMHALAGRSPFDVHKLPEKSSTEPLELNLEIQMASSATLPPVGASDAEASARSRLRGEIPASDKSDCSLNSPAVILGSQRSKRRKDEEEEVTVMEKVPASCMGNLENPPDDGFTWRKYGQKDILNSRFPRSYYRCTHKNYYGCEAKKQVQRVNNEPSMFEITYRGRHTCQTSRTPLIIASSHHTCQRSSVNTSILLGSWLSREFDVGQKREKSGLTEEKVGMNGNNHLECSHVLGGKELEWPVVDLADAMFNTGSSSSNSMDAIFSSHH